MGHINQVVVSGRATRDPELRTFEETSNLTTFGIAVERQWKSKDGERQSKTSFFDVKFWGPFADVIANKVRKGDPVTVSGELDQETWTNEAGENRSKVVITGRQLDSDALFRKADGSDTPDREAAPQQDPLPSPRPSSPPAAQPAAVAAAPVEAGPDYDDIPF